MTATSTDPSVFSVQANHPALPGHFPGNPVVPGVLILEYVLRAYEALQSCPTPLRRLTDVKFLQPLRPGETADIAFDVKSGKVTFSVVRGGTLIAKGAFELGGGTAS